MKENFSEERKIFITNLNKNRIYTEDKRLKLTIHYTKPN